MKNLRLGIIPWIMTTMFFLSTFHALRIVHFSRCELFSWNGEGLDARCVRSPDQTVRSSINISKKTFVPIMIDSSEPRHDF